MVYLMIAIAALEILGISDLLIYLSWAGQIVDQCGRKPKAFATAYLPSHCLLLGGEGGDNLLNLRLGLSSSGDQVSSPSL